MFLLMSQEMMLVGVKTFMCSQPIEKKSTPRLFSPFLPKEKFVSIADPEIIYPFARFKPLKLPGFNDSIL
jgi:hypothetical protein